MLVSLSCLPRHYSAQTLLTQIITKTEFHSQVLKYLNDLYWTVKLTVLCLLVIEVTESENRISGMRLLG